MPPPNDLVAMNRQIEMMQDPDRWPAWPFLPLINRGEQPGETAYLFEEVIGERTLPVCRKGNMFTASKADPEIEYESFTQLLNMGWEVD